MHVCMSACVHACVCRHALVHACSACGRRTCREPHERQLTVSLFSRTRTRSRTRRHGHAHRDHSEWFVSTTRFWDTPGAGPHRPPIKPRALQSAISVVAPLVCGHLLLQRVLIHVSFVLRIPSPEGLFLLLLVPSSQVLIVVHGCRRCPPVRANARRRRFTTRSPPTASCGLS